MKETLVEQINEPGVKQKQKKKKKKINYSMNKNETKQNWWNFTKFHDGWNQSGGGGEMWEKAFVWPQELPELQTASVTS